ncbi:uncharacterized protein [Macrobrachium rosenbergii]|uniref:uncharacterized protein n=1 Tax=Macrobrachium rosenbergii TaxID=79674 RepID=UPI0034D4DB61
MRMSFCKLMWHWEFLQALVALGIFASSCGIGNFCKLLWHWEFLQARVALGIFATTCGIGNFCKLLWHWEFLQPHVALGIFASSYGIGNFCKLMWHWEFLQAHVALGIFASSYGIGNFCKLLRHWEFLQAHVALGIFASSCGIGNFCKLFGIGNFCKLMWHWEFLQALVALGIFATTCGIGNFCKLLWHWEFLQALVALGIFASSCGVGQLKLCHKSVVIWVALYSRVFVYHICSINQKKSKWFYFQLRKNCLPERPKKKRRKPRPKKKLRRRCDSPVSEVNVTDCKESANCEELGQANILARSSSTASEQEASDLIRMSSIDQDSGISLSQYTYTSSSQCTENEPSCSKTLDIEGPSSSVLSPTIEEEPEKSSVIVESSERKRKLSSLKEDIHVKISKGHSSDFEDKMCDFEDEVSEIEMKLITDTAKFINSKGSGLATVDSDKLTVSEPAGEESHMCMLCCLRPKNAVIIHGRLSHQATCYQCARRLLNSGARCPVCRRKIHMVCKNIVV